MARPSHSPVFSAFIALALSGLTATSATVVTYCNGQADSPDCAGVTATMCRTSAFDHCPGHCGTCVRSSDNQMRGGIGKASKGKKKSKKTGKGKNTKNRGTGKKGKTEAGGLSAVARYTGEHAASITLVASCVALIVGASVVAVRRRWAHIEASYSLPAVSPNEYQILDDGTKCPGVADIDESSRLYKGSPITC